MRLTIAVLGASIAAAGAGAQATSARLEGRILGDDASVPAAARIEVLSRETGTRRFVVADDEGRYLVLSLPPGSYDIGVRALGYRQQRREAVRLIVGDRAVIDFTLERGAVELEPTVVVGTRALEIDRRDVSTPIVQEQIDKLPLNTRNVLNVAAIVPGVRTYAPEVGRSLPHAGAVPGARLANLYVDGVEFKGTYAGIMVGAPGLGSILPQESVREFRVSMNPYDAEYTRGASWVMSAVTHRGSNRLEGSLFGFMQDQSLTAKGSFQLEEPDYRRYQTGFNLRGPVVRNRLFFSASYEGHRENQYITVTPGRPAVNSGIWDRYAGTFAAPLRTHTSVLRLTAPLGSHTLDATWIGRHVVNESAFGLRAAGYMLSYDAGLDTRVRMNSLILTDSYVAGRVVNELTLHLIDNSHHEHPLRAGPTYQYPGIQLGRITSPLLIRARHLRAVNKTSLQLGGGSGRHLLKWGLEVTRMSTDSYRPSSREGLFRFDHDTSTLPSFAQIAVGLNDPSGTSEARDLNQGWSFGAYLQDEWQPVPSLTITAGVRFDAELHMLNQRRISPWASDTTLQRVLGDQFLNSGDREHDLDNIAPRLAVSWDVLGRGHTYLRAGYGVIYDRTPVVPAHDEAFGIGWRVYTFQNPGTTDPEELRRRIATGGGVYRPNLVMIEDRMETPKNRQWSLGAGRRFGASWAANVDYLDQRLSDTHVTIRANLRHPVTRARPLTDRFGDITLWRDIGDAEFRALLVSLSYDRRQARVSAAYTLAWAKSEFGEFTNSDYPDSVAYVLQRSEGDERHRLVLSGLTPMPFGLELSGIAIFASPRPFLVFAGSDVNQNGSDLDDWPGGVRTHRRGGWDHWYRTIDLRLARTVPAGRGRLMVTGEVFNLFSWRNHSEYQARASLTGYGEPIGDYARRQAQLGIRYRF